MTAKPSPPSTPLNTCSPPSDVRRVLGVADTVQVACVDASGIALDTIKRDIPNTPIVGALVTLETGGGPEVLHVSTRWFELNTERHALHIFKSMTRELARQEVEVWKRTIRVVSHEVDNSLGPVSSLVSSGRAILDRPEHAHRLREVLGTIQERVEHLRTFLDGYARLARLPAPRPGPVEWPRFLSSLNVLYPFRLDGAVPAEPGWFDATQLQQVLVNLLKNAVESGSARDEIALRVKRADGRVEIAVLDRGAGLAPDQTQRFEEDGTCGGRAGQEEAETRGGFTVQAEQEPRGDGDARARNARLKGQRLSHAEAEARAHPDAVERSPRLGSLVDDVQDHREHGQHHGDDPGLSELPLDHVLERGPRQGPGDRSHHECPADPLVHARDGTAFDRTEPCDRVAHHVLAEVDQRPHQRA